MREFISLVSDLTTGLIGTAILAVLLLYLYWRFIDRHSTDPVRRNFPGVAHIRGALIHMGEYLRTWVLAADREEKPFDRVQRNWVKAASEGREPIASFGSTSPDDTTIFLPSAFPILDQDSVHAAERIIGEYTDHPYVTRNLFGISAMSFGALGKHAVLSLGQGASASGTWMNSGEGGVSPYHLETGVDLIAQIGTAKYGFRDADGNLDMKKVVEMASHPSVKMFEIKLSQGAKPGKGGILPGAKVTSEIAAIRGIPAGEDSISPNRHPDISDTAALLEMVSKIRRATGKPCGIKFVMGSGSWVDELCSMIDTKEGPDFITLDSGTGGTGAAPQTLLDYVGMPIEWSLPKLVGMMKKYNIYDAIEVFASGKLITPDKVAWALANGADFVSSARGFMFSLGCLMTLKCNEGKCPVGITTHDPNLQLGLKIDQAAIRVSNYINRIEHEVGVIAHSVGVVEPRQLRLEHIGYAPPVDNKSSAT